MAKTENIKVSGVVTQVLSNGRYEVETDIGHKIIAYTSGKIRNFKIKIVEGDRVDLEVSEYDLSNGRITYRQK